MDDVQIQVSTGLLRACLNESRTDLDFADLIFGLKVPE